MRKGTTLRTCLLLCVLAITSLPCACPWLFAQYYLSPMIHYYLFPDPICVEAPYSPPSSSFVLSDIAGTWEARYHPGVDTLHIREDGTFRQLYVHDDYWRHYEYETPWNEWWSERLPDDIMRIHLPGARYYLRGIGIGEREAFSAPCPAGTPRSRGASCSAAHSFVDPFTRELVVMPRELVLTVRVDSSGELLLHHMFYSLDEGFGLSGCHSYQFRRFETP